MGDYSPVYDVLREGVIIATKIAGPVLLISMAIGLTISIIQAATQIHEQTITFVPKLLLLALILTMAGPWMLELLVDYTKEIFSAMLEL
ncbi:flagellar biosynthesis protein FliQ [Clostridium aminobutyricum]|uniref:Flagellar biosynthetic protein FliQ n=1 Tax=Clostridium aminobutyricum TaxID=33953 RepID=A0A939IHH3_CLOAM|nr:flagellar biosynthesis protein FliQ [Clostridium aminobutyricum]MBN7773757.1 flagellar biosynthesis protein FliQ [Clostridium aminobutyricum]